MNDLNQASINNKINQVTPLSKFLAALLFIALPFLGFFLGMEYAKQSFVQEVLIQPELQPEAIPTPVFGTLQWWSDPQVSKGLADEPQSVSSSASTQSQMVEPKEEWQSIVIDTATWEKHVNPAGFSFLAPEEIYIKEGPNYASFLRIESQDIGYTINYKNGIKSEDDLVIFVKEVYGEGCKIELSDSVNATHGVSEYYVLRSDTTAAPCNDYKKKVLFNPKNEVVVSWGLGQEPILPIYPDSYTRWLNEIRNGLSGGVYFYDFLVLDSFSLSEVE